MNLDQAWQSYTRVAFTNAGFAEELAMYDLIRDVAQVQLQPAIATWTIGTSRPRPNVAMPPRDKIMLSMGHNLAIQVERARIRALRNQNFTPAATVERLQVDQDAEDISTMAIDDPVEEHQSPPTLGHQHAQSGSSLSSLLSGSSLPTRVFRGIPDLVIYARETRADNGENIAFASRVALVLEVKKDLGNTRPWGGRLQSTLEQLDRCAQLLSYAYYMTYANDSREAVIAYWTPRRVDLIGFYRRSSNREGWNSIRVAGNISYNLANNQDRNNLNIAIVRLVRAQVPDDPFAQGGPLAAIGMNTNNLQSILVFRP